MEVRAAPVVLGMAMLVVACTPSAEPGDGSPDLSEILANPPPAEVQESYHACMVEQGFPPDEVNEEYFFDEHGNPIEGTISLPQEITDAEIYCIDQNPEIVWGYFTPEEREQQRIEAEQQSHEMDTCLADRGWDMTQMPSLYLELDDEAEEAFRRDAFWCSDELDYNLMEDEDFRRPDG